MRKHMGLTKVRDPKVHDFINRNVFDSDDRVDAFVERVLKGEPVEHLSRIMTPEERRRAGKRLR